MGIKKRKIIVSIICTFLILCCVVVGITTGLLSRISYTLVDNPQYEVNTENTITSLFSEISIGTLENSDTVLDTTQVGEKIKRVTVISQLGTKQIFDVLYYVVDTTPPTITGDDELTFKTTDEADILSHYKAEDNSEKEVGLSIDGDYDLKKAGDYKIYIVAKDESKNETKKEITLKITEPQRAVVTRTTSTTKYYIEINRKQNVVIVYSSDQNGNFSNISKVFVASTGAPGSETPLGTFTVSDRYEVLHLVGDVWGHYTLRINGHIFFHSVPYFTKGAPWNNLEYLEYNKLGSGASAGCVRLAVRDAKWIYDNIPYGATVKIYDSDTLPSGVVKPSAIKIDPNSKNRGWDPTDPDPANPWE